MYKIMLISSLAFMAICLLLSRPQGSSAGEIPMLFDFKDAQFAAPEKIAFNSFLNRVLVSKHTPHHNGFDQVFVKDEAQYIEGKFQYGDARKDLEGEWVSVYEWSFADNEPKWKLMTRLKTDDDGRIHYDIPSKDSLGVGLHIIKLFVEGDGTQTNMYINVLDGTSKYVVFDIDGTLTTSDMEEVYEFINELFDGRYAPKMYEGATEIAKYYKAKGYNVLYLTARPYWLAERTQHWLVKQGFPQGLMHTNDGTKLLNGTDAMVFKRDYLKTLVDKGIRFSYAYGNAQSDIDAYTDIGVAPDHICIIGPNGGLSNTIAIKSYPEHLAELEKQ